MSVCTTKLGAPILVYLISWVRSRGIEKTKIHYCLCCVFSLNLVCGYKPLLICLIMRLVQPYGSPDRVKVSDPMIHSNSSPENLNQRLKPLRILITPEIPRENENDNKPRSENTVF